MFYILFYIFIYIYIYIFCNYLFLLYEQNVNIHCTILVQLIFATYFKHIGVPVKEVISLLLSVIPA